MEIDYRVRILIVSKRDKVKINSICSDAQFIISKQIILICSNHVVFDSVLSPEKFSNAILLTFSQTTDCNFD